MLTPGSNQTPYRSQSNLDLSCLDTSFACLGPMLCTRSELFGQVNEEFAFGTPEKCADKYSVSYLGSLYIYHGCQWMVIFLTGYLGSKYGPLIMILSCALSGATLTVTANLTLARTILTYIGWSKTLGKINILFTNYGTVAIYIVTILGCLSMLMIRGFVKEMKKQEAIKKVRRLVFHPGNLAVTVLVY